MVRDVTEWRCTSFIGPVCQKHQRLWGKLWPDYIAAITAGVRHKKKTSVTSVYSRGNIATFKVFSSSSVSSVLKINLAQGWFWQIKPMSLQPVSILPFNSGKQKTKQEIPECSLLAGQKAFRGQGGDVESGRDDSDVEEAFRGYCSAFQRETGSFIYLYLYKHLDHKHLKHHR